MRKLTVVPMDLMKNKRVEQLFAWNSTTLDFSENLSEKLAAKFDTCASFKIQRQVHFL